MKNFIKLHQRLFWIMVLLTLQAGAYAQNVEFTRSAFPDQAAALRQSSRNMKTGETLFEQGGARTLESLTYLMKAQEFNPNNANLNYMIGRVLLRTVQYAQAVEFLHRAKNLGISDQQINFYIGEAYHLNMNFDKAIEYYSIYRNLHDPQKTAISRPLIDRRIAQCQTGLTLVAKPERVFIDNIGVELNSVYNDYNPRLWPNWGQMFFTSRRPLSEKAKTDPRDFMYFETILVAENTNGSWRTLKYAEPAINRKNHSSLLAFTPDGITSVIYNGAKGGDILISDYKNGRWGKPSKLRSGINSRHKETSAALSAGRDTLYFISDRPGGYGGKDIWFTNKVNGGRWRQPINLGPVLNTEVDEEALYLTPDGKTLYFSSQGHKSIGGFDIFRSNFSMGRWSEPENLGYPINGPTDDLFYIPDPAGRSAYFSSMRAGGQGGTDIYMVTFMGPEKPVINQMLVEPLAGRARPNLMHLIDQSAPPTTPFAIMRGLVLDNKTGQPLKAYIEIHDQENDTLLTTFTSNAETGAYLISLPTGKNFGISVQAEGYLFHSENINIATANMSTEIISDFRLKPIEVGTTIVLRNIFFDTGSANLRPESYAELGVLYKLLVDNPRLKIEISGHTDNVGSAAVNQRLSHDRARTVVNFLTGRGISAERLTFRGYGFSRPVATNNTPEGRQLNRRTEFEIKEN